MLLFSFIVFVAANVTTHLSSLIRGALIWDPFHELTFISK